MTNRTMKHSIETWWDATTRLWITQVKDTEGNQIGSALYAGSKASAKVNHSDCLAYAATLEA